jgi:hypothetical protein
MRLFGGVRRGGARDETTLPKSGHGRRWAVSRLVNGLLPHGLAAVLGRRERGEVA